MIENYKKGWERVRFLACDMRTFSFLENAVVLADLLLNPKATDYPIACYSDDILIDTYPDGHILTVYFKNNKMLYIRWL